MNPDYESYIKLVNERKERIRKHLESGKSSLTFIDNEGESEAFRKIDDAWWTYTKNAHKHPDVR